MLNVITVGHRIFAGSIYCDFRGLFHEPQKKVPALQKENDEINQTSRNITMKLFMVIGLRGVQFGLYAYE